jgi:hypothetical protein
MPVYAFQVFFPFFPFLHIHYYDAWLIAAPLPPHLDIINDIAHYCRLPFCRDIFRCAISTYCRRHDIVLHTYIRSRPMPPFFTLAAIFSPEQAFFLHRYTPALGRDICYIPRH